jgi:methyl coenzyme M reductase gamma subunit
VADAVHPLHRLGEEHLLQLGDLPGFLAHQQVAVLGHGDPGRVVAAVLQPLEPLDEQRRDLLVADVSHDPAHVGRSRVDCVSESALSAA